MAARKSTASKPSVRKVRNLRHWKQQYDANAKFVARKTLKLIGGTLYAGDVLPQEVVDGMGRSKLKRFWQSRYIELAEFEAPQSYGKGTPLINEEARAITEAKAEQDALMAEITAEAILEADGVQPTGEE
jgi:hypothetical protein